MARPAGSTFEAILALAREAGAGAFWGLVRRKTQTHLPWRSWTNPGVVAAKDGWFHDLFDEGADEIAFLRLPNGLDVDAEAA